MIFSKILNYAFVTFLITMSRIRTVPLANIIALFGVATGSINAKLTDKINGKRR